MGVVVTVQVEKSFLIIGLNGNSKDVTRFVWLKDLQKSSTFTDSNGVLFSLVSSPFILNADIK